MWKTNENRQKKNPIRKDKFRERTVYLEFQRYWLFSSFLCDIFSTCSIKMFISFDMVIFVIPNRIYVDSERNEGKRSKKKNRMNEEVHTEWAKKRISCGVEILIVCLLRVENTRISSVRAFFRKSDEHESNGVTVALRVWVTCICRICVCTWYDGLSFSSHSHSRSLVAFHFEMEFGWMW